MREEMLARVDRGSTEGPAGGLRQASRSHSVRKHSEVPVLPARLRSRLAAARLREPGYARTTDVDGGL